jgi:antitoxin PrlF
MNTMVTSKLTERSQTTLPAAVRTVLGLEPGERIGYLIEGNSVRIINADQEEHDDPAIARFLEFLGQDLNTHPERLEALPADLIARARALTQHVTIDHDAPIDGRTAL